MAGKSARYAHMMLFKVENSMWTNFAHHPYFENWALIIIIPRDSRRKRNTCRVQMLPVRKHATFDLTMVF